MPLEDKPFMTGLTDMEYWADNPSATLGQYAQENINPELLLGLMSLMWPNLVLHEDRVFLADTFSRETFEKWKGTELFDRGGMPAIQAVMNHVHVGDFFYRVGDQLSEENVEFAARVLAGAWKSRLESEFPKRKFIVESRCDEVHVYEA
jgi:hypothetical protein